MADDSEQSGLSPLEERIASISHIGPWELGQLIGKGASGAVHIAVHKSTGQKAAIKVISTEAIWNSHMSLTSQTQEADRAIQNIEREIVIMKLMEHPNILSLLDVWEAKGLLFVVMEYIDGGELFGYLVKRSRLSVPETLHYFQQIMYGVAYCHRFHIAHRDLKTENILLDSEGNVKVADFGMAMFTPRDSLLYTSCGSPHYASPEVVSGLPYNGYIADVWSCGVVLYAMLAGTLPFEDKSVLGVLEKVKAAQYAIPIGVPWPAQNLIRRMMEKDPERRITVAEILTHPFFRSVPPRSPPVLPPTFSNLASIVPLNYGSGSIDSEVLKNMRALWLNRQDSDIIRAIRNGNDSWEKVVYYLLSEFRKKRLQSIGPNGHRRTPEHRRQKLKQLNHHSCPGDNSVVVGDTSVAAESVVRIFERPSAPTPSRARSRSVSADFSVSGDSTVLNTTAPLTPRKRNKAARTSSSSDLPDIVVQSATPRKKSARASVDSPLGYEDTNTKTFQYLDPRSCNDTSDIVKVEPFVPLSGPDMQEDVFFQQIAEMLVNMSKRHDSEGENHRSSNPTCTRIPKQLKVPAAEIPPPPTTPATPAFKEANTCLTPLQTTAPTIRMVQQPGVLTPSNLNKPVQPPDSKAAPRPRSLKERVVPPKSILTKPTPAKENIPVTDAKVTALSRDMRETTFGIEPTQPSSTKNAPPKKRVHIVTPDPSVFERTRRRSKSMSREETRSSENWFSNLFHFKPNRQELHSLHDVFSTRERCISTLRGLGAQVEAGEPLPYMYGGSTLHCVLDEIVDPSGTVTVNKPLRFHVEIRPTTGVQYASGYLSELVLVREKGQPASFNALCTRLRRGWELDVTCHPDGSMDVLTLGDDSAFPSPALTVGGRYAEV